MHQLVARLMPICRSITGNGVRETLKILGERLPLEVHEVPTGTAVFDWTVPKEWNIRGAFIEDEAGRRILDFADSALHVVGYSTPIDRWMTLEELQPHLHSLEEKPDAIPYITSYYAERWGFCLEHRKRSQLAPGRYHVVIDSELQDGHLTYGECVLPGEENREVLLSTYVCHPTMANNELSGPVVQTCVAEWLLSKPRRYTYRLVFVPETIGSITYLSRCLPHLKRHVVAGFNLTCLGDERGYSSVATRYGDTLADRIVANVLRTRRPVTQYTFLGRGSDERQYCSPGVDLPVVTLCRSRFAAYPEYHTSLDNLDVVTPTGLQGGYELVRECLEAVEANRVYAGLTCCEPQLGRRGLYPTLSTLSSRQTVALMTDVIAYADGTNDLVEISNIIEQPMRLVAPMAERLAQAGVLSEVPGGVQPRRR